MRPTNSPSSETAPGARTILCLLAFGEDHPIEAKISDGLQEAVCERGYRPVVGVVPIDPREEMRRLVEKHSGTIAGIAVQPYRPTREVAEMLVTSPVKNLPTVLIGHYYNDLLVDSCVIDNYGGMYAATEHLIRCGRRRLCYVGELSLSSTEHERYLGFTMACVHNGIQVPQAHYVDLFHRTDLRVRFADLLSSENPPDGIVCLYDTLAIHVLDALADLKVDVPGRVSVVSFGDDEGLAEQATPALSTGYHPSRTMGQIAGHRLADVVEGLVPPAPQVVVVPVGFHVRESCGAVARGLAAFDSFQEVPFSGFVGRLAVPPTQRNRP